MCRAQFVLPLVALYVGLTHSWDIAVSVGDRLIFYTNETKTNTVSFKSQNLTALTYDEVHNMILYVDKQNNNDTICGYDISSMNNKCFIKRNGRNIAGLAFDPILELLFFTDANERSINWISLKPGSTNNVYGNLLIKIDDGIPSDIAIDGCKRHIYWINNHYEIERAQFDGLERQAFIRDSTTHLLHLAIDHQAQKIYYIDGYENDGTFYLSSADLIISQNFKFVQVLKEKQKINTPIAMTVSKDSIFVIWSGNYKSIWQLPRNIYDVQPKDIIQFYDESPIGIVTNYKIKEGIQGIQNCEALTSLILNSSVTNDSESEIAAESGPFCVHGIKVDGQSLCTCTPGYIGERCDVLVCENYCFQGNCSVNDEGLPKCRCNADYSGDRCEVSACHGYCLNNGVCFLNEKDEPACQCIGSHEGSRCEAVNNNTITFTITPKDSKKTKRNLTLADLLSSWRKPIVKISVIVEV